MVMIVAPPGSAITSIEKLKDHTVGVVGSEINHCLVAVPKKEYDLARANVTFRDIAPADTRRAVQSKEVSALLLVIRSRKNTCRWCGACFAKARIRLRCCFRSSPPAPLPMWTTPTKVLLFRKARFAAHRRFLLTT